MKAVTVGSTILSSEDILRLEKYELKSGQCVCGGDCLKPFFGAEGSCERERRVVSLESSCVFLFRVGSCCWTVLRAPRRLSVTCAQVRLRRREWGALSVLTISFSCLTQFVLRRC